LGPSREAIFVEVMTL